MEPTRVFDLVYYHHIFYKDVPIYAYKSNKKWIHLYTTEFISLINTTSKWLVALGVKPNDKIGIISENRYEWNVLDFAIQQIGAVVVGVYPNISDEDYIYILNHAEVSIAFTSNTSLFDRIKNIQGEISSLKHLYTFDEDHKHPNWLQAIDSQKIEISDHILEDLKSRVTTDTLATLIYTSGTTGKPKGVMLSHKNILADTMSSEYSFPVKDHQRALSFLPICHAYERIFQYVYIYKGLTIYYAESIDSISENILEVKPHIFSAVPRILEKIYEKIVHKGQQLSGIKRKLFFWALKVGEQYEFDNQSLGYKLKLSLARKLVFSKWRAALGGEILGIASGSAALQEKLVRIYTAAGINIYEGYGLTEAGPCLSVNDFKRGMKIGTVGVPLINIEIKLAHDGEVLAKGDNIMLGYYKDEIATKQAIVDGWLHTGDIGQWVENKFLKIIDRKKEMFKTSGGKYIVPQAIESKMTESPYIEQFMVIGEGQKFPAGFVVPAYENLLDWAKSTELNINSLTKEEFFSLQEVKQKIAHEIENINLKFGKWEQIKKFAIINHEFTVENGDLTPTLKMKRKIILDKLKKEYQRLYH